MKLKNEVYRFFRNESKKLETEWYSTRHGFDRQTIMENIDFKSKNNDTVTQDDYSYEQKHRVNHARRLKRIFKNLGWEGVHKYFYDRGLILMHGNSPAYQM